MKRVIIAGSRTLPSTPQQEDEIKLWLETAVKLFKPDVILCGDARGIDALGNLLGVAKGISVEHYPADWDTHGKRAGFLRNEKMAQEATDLWLIWDGKSPGSKMMKNLAIHYKLNVLEYIV